MIGLALLADELRPYLPGWWVTLAWVCAALGVAGAAGRRRPRCSRPGGCPSLAEGPAGDIFDDVGAWLPRSLAAGRGAWPWSWPAAIFVLLTVAGCWARTAYDGVARGVGDGLLCLLGFATLGRYLGLWAPGSPTDGSGRPPRPGEDSLPWAPVSARTASQARVRRRGLLWPLAWPPAVVELHLEHGRQRPQHRRGISHDHRRDARARGLEHERHRTTSTHRPGRCGGGRRLSDLEPAICRSSPARARPARPT